MIEVTDIHKSFGALKVLDGVSFDIARGKVTAIVGPSGAGKTTLLQIMGSLENPDAGRVVIDGTDIFRLSPDKMARFRGTNIGFVFQFHRLLGEFTLVENVELPALIAGVNRRKARDRAMHLINYLGLGDRAGHHPAQLSGGECQRAAVARALVNSPAVVLADEPTGSLDSHNRAELQRLFFDLSSNLGQTFVIVTHDEHIAADAHTVIRLADGKVADITNSQPE